MYFSTDLVYIIYIGYILVYKSDFCITVQLGKDVLPLRGARWRQRGRHTKTFDHSKASYRYAAIKKKKELHISDNSGSFNPTAGRERMLDNNNNRN